ncbi:ArsR/SmtB family transcription factor [Streptomyces spectabilis]|uniref:Winged helix-turn-helix transcriptional regulator n=1 Tax=Streptomyces spectabilis TaxID=68270 RepID=A0A516R2T0_STRST|nr:metalloregulator ArsR/SmtB family transcription factor [Streptomyces spectabilis]QDQ09951.1 winged helix-turn-helix transcriptional regulator [Streptomyces spectabilis]
MNRVPSSLREAQAELFQALGHPVRVRVLEVLQDGPIPVQELLAALELEIESSELARQLAMLLGCGVVTVNRRGTAAVYEGAGEDVAELLAVARRISSVRLSGLSEPLEPVRGPGRGAEPEPAP